MSAPNQSEDFWKKQLENLKESGLSRAQYCRENRVNYDRLGYWIKKLRPIPSTFLPIKVQETDPPPHHTILCTLNLGSHVLKIHDISALSFVLERLSQ